MAVIYVDILLALNLFIDYLLLAAVARLLNRPLRRLRHLAAALLGAASSLLMLLPTLPVAVVVIAQFTVAAGMVLTAFGTHGVRRFWQETALLFVISALFAGVCYLVQPWFSSVGFTVRNGVCYYAVPPLLLIAFTVGSYGVLCLFERLTKKRIADRRSYRVEILDGRCLIVLHAMLDSGHSLCDSFSGSPVILSKERVLRPLCACYEAAAANGVPRGPIRYIPYHCLAGDGVLAAFRPQRVTLYADGQSVDVTGVWVAATTALLRDEYDALIGPALADRLP